MRHLSKRASQVLKLAHEAAQEYGQGYVGKQRSVQGLVPPGTEKPLLDFYKKNTGGLKSKQIKK